MPSSFDKMFGRFETKFDKLETNFDKIWDRANGIFDRVFDEVVPTTTKATKRIRVRLTPKQVVELLDRKQLTFKVNDDIVIQVEM